MGQTSVGHTKCLLVVSGTPIGSRPRPRPRFLDCLEGVPPRVFSESWTDSFARSHTEGSSFGSLRLTTLV